MKGLLEEFLNNNKRSEYLYSLDENGNLLFMDNISKINNEWILFQRKEKLKILNTLENE